MEVIENVATKQDIGFAFVGEYLDWTRGAVAERDLDKVGGYQQDLSTKSGNRQLVEWYEAQPGYEFSGDDSPVGGRIDLSRQVIERITFDGRTKRNMDEGSGRIDLSVICVADHAFGLSTGRGEGKRTGDEGTRATRLTKIGMWPNRS